MAPFGASTPKGSVHSTRAIISRGNCAPACRKAHRRSQSALRRFLMLIWNRGEGLFAGLALNCLGIQPSQHSWHMDVLAMRARPGGLRREFLPAASSRHNSSSARLLVCAGNGLLVRHTAVLVGAGVAHCPSAIRAHERVLDTPSRPTAIHTGQSDGPISMARSPVRSPSGMTHTSHRSWAGMAGFNSLQWP
jgi:hypothetical protein